MLGYENDDVRISASNSFESVTIWYKKRNEILICENKYLISLSRELGPRVDKIEPNS